MGKTFTIDEILAELADPDFSPPTEKSFTDRVIESISETAATARKVFVCFYQDPDDEYAKALHITEARAYKGEEGRSQVICQLTKHVSGVGRVAIRDHQGLLLYDFSPLPTHFSAGTEITIDIPSLKDSL